MAELLTVIVKPQRLNLAIGSEHLQLSKEQVAEWERKWAAPVERIEQVGGSGKAWTKAEKEAGADEARLLNQDEPLPQTIYRVIAKSGDSLLVTVQLLYRTGASSGSYIQPDHQSRVADTGNTLYVRRLTIPAKDAANQTVKEGSCDKKSLLY